MIKRIFDANARTFNAGRWLSIKSSSFLLSPFQNQFPVISTELIGVCFEFTVIKIYIHIFGESFYCVPLISWPVLLEVASRMAVRASFHQYSIYRSIDWISFPRPPNFYWLNNDYGLTQCGVVWIGTNQMRRRSTHTFWSLDLFRMFDLPLMITLSFWKRTSHGDGGSPSVHESSGSGSVDVSTVKSPNNTNPDSPGCKWYKMNY